MVAGQLNKFNVTDLLLRNVLKNQLFLYLEVGTRLEETDTETKKITNVSGF